MLFDRSLKSGVYLITCLPLDKHYVGVSDNVRTRINAHKSALKRNCHEIAALQADYNEHKQGNFLFQKLLVGAGWPKESLEKLEVAILLTLPLPGGAKNVITNTQIGEKEILKQTLFLVNVIPWKLDKHKVKLIRVENRRLQVVFVCSTK